MSKKKSVSVKKKKRFAAEKKLSTKEMGFFQRLKDVLPEQRPAAKETVRVKTYIVEKPVYINAGERGRVSPPPQKYGFDDGKKFDSRKSRYAKRRAEKEIAPEDNPEEFNDEGLTQQDELSAGETEGEDALAQGDEQFEEGAGAEGEALEGEGEFDDGAEEGGSATSLDNPHRSRVMFNGIWWKRALFWGILAWLIILAGEVALHAINLVDLNLNRQWWVLLGIIIFISLIYHAFFADKHLI
ncbi:Uncharacterised protein [uncultured archaeon]|nr:Uncharacterised protein [uncultured archaeon]